MAKLNDFQRMRNLQTTGWLLLFFSFITGFFGDFRTNAKGTWHSKLGQSLRKCELVKKKQRKSVSAWPRRPGAVGKGRAAIGEHPYLTRKGIAPVGEIKQP